MGSHDGRLCKVKLMGIISLLRNAVAVSWLLKRTCENHIFFESSIFSLYASLLADWKAFMGTYKLVAVVAYKDKSVICFGVKLQLFLMQRSLQVLQQQFTDRLPHVMTQDFDSPMGLFKYRNHC